MKSTTELFTELEQTQALLLHSQTEKELAAYRKDLESLINTLIQQDFSLLVQWLYRLDVDEQKIKSALAAQPGTDAAVVLATLMLERQAQKLKSRDLFHGSADIPEEDRW